MVPPGVPSVMGVTTTTDSACGSPKPVKASPGPASLVLVPAMRYRHAQSLAWQCHMGLQIKMTCQMQPGPVDIMDVQPQLTLDVAPRAVVLWRLSVCPATDPAHRASLQALAQNAG